MKRTLIALITIMAFVTMSCSTLVRIETDIPGAEVRINNKEIGKTPLETKLSNDAFKTYRVEIAKEGYDTLHTDLDKEVKAGNLIAGLIIIWPLLLWCYGPAPYQHFDLDKN